MSWIIIAFFGPALHGFSTIIDNYLTDTIFKNIFVQIFYTTLFWIFFLPLTFFIGLPEIPPLHLFPFLFLIGFIEVAYVYPYLQALRHDDTSVVSSLFSLGKFLIPLFAFLFLGEKLLVIQYVGFGIIILSSAALTLTDHVSIRFNKSFAYMLLCSLLLAVEAVTYKGLFEAMSWSTAFFWVNMCSFFILLFCFLFFPAFRAQVKIQKSAVRKHFWLLGCNEILVFFGTAATTLAISLAPALTLMKSIESFQPLFVVVYALMLRRFYPRLFRENGERHSLYRKVVLFAIMILGVALVVK